MSTDSQLARTWLRLGVQGDRCDLFAVREEGARIVLECIEVKTTKGRPRGHAEAEIVRAREQVGATLTAVRDGLGDSAAAEAHGHYLSAPRNEMLKEVLVQGCMSRFATRDERARWSAWFERLFGPNPESPALLGLVVDVALGSAEERGDEDFSHGDLTIRLEHLNEVDVQRLLEPAESRAEDRGSGSNRDAAAALTSAGLAASARSGSVVGSDVVSTDDSIDLVDGEEETAEAISVRSSSGTGSSDVSPWPPSPNVFGLIGQEVAATKLQNKAEMSQGTGRRFTDTLFIGPAGVGKSSLARAVASQLGFEPIFFSGSDLSRPTGLVERLREKGKIQKHTKGQTRIGKALIFIDEVHALKKGTMTVLLSAMDDARVATIDGVEYDFAEVVFIAATTDKGLLSEAFQSRMDMIPLSSYTLDELAGIIHYHASQQFGGFDLPRDICFEMAARNRCNPRRAVRSLVNDLLAEFYSRLTVAQKKQKKRLEPIAAAMMTVENVGEYYDRHGIDLNGVDELGRKTLQYLKVHGATPEDRLSKGLHISNRSDFSELVEYLSRLGLLTTGSQGRKLTAIGRQYLERPSDLRARI